MLKHILKSPPVKWNADSVTSAHTAQLQIQYLGTAGFIISNAERTLVLDPFITRQNAWHTLTQPLISDSNLVKQLIPHADDVLIGHAHYDHILDAPEICKQTGARLIGSRATLMYGKSAGLKNAQMLEVKGHEEVTSGKWLVKALPSIHGKALFGKIPLPGDMIEPPPYPPKFHQLKHGDVLNWWIDTGDLKIVHIDSADFLDEHLSQVQADIVCLCAIGRKYRPNYVRDVVRYLKPKYIIPCHWDTMMTPIHAPPYLLPSVNIPEFLKEIESFGVKPLFTPILGKLYF